MLIGSYLGNLLYTVATKPSPAVENRKQLLAEYVAAGKISSSAQLDIALEYLKSKAGEPNVDIAEFEKKAGVGLHLLHQRTYSVVLLLGRCCYY